MQILLANAKLMHESSKFKAQSSPQFQEIANILAQDMANCDVKTLQKELDCSHALAAENQRRYRDFFIAEKMPAIMAYNGQAYKHLKAATLNEEALAFGQKHLWITCFLYGLLRPMDAIVPYRMEHCVKLPATNGNQINTFWKNILTDTLINSVKADDGILLHLSTEEYEHLLTGTVFAKKLKSYTPFSM